MKAEREVEKIEKAVEKAEKGAEKAIEKVEKDAAATLDKYIHIRSLQSLILKNNAII